ncbi:MAG: AlpA family phage regulatory protein [Alteromonadaceae bacterium]|nr:AlpA family phage regulatory protein [Alteromonadaceae bacterium]
MKLLSTKQICEIFGVSDRTIFNWRKNNANFPKPVAIGGGSNKYKENEIYSFIESCSR